MLTGFSRIDANVEMEQSGFEQLWGAAPDSAHDRDWLLAHRVYGEGILLVLDPDAIDRWDHHEPGLRAMDDQPARTALDGPSLACAQPFPRAPT